MATIKQKQMMDCNYMSPTALDSQSHLKKSLELKLQLEHPKGRETLGHDHTVDPSRSKDIDILNTIS